MSSLIPKKIYQSWKTKDMSNLSKKMLNAIDSIKELNPDYTYELFDDVDCRKFILDNFGAIYADAFDDLIPGAFKSDFWRYAKLYIDGGVYMDIDFTELVPLDNIIKKDDILLSVVDIKNIKDKPPCSIFQAFIACVPKHKILLKAFEISFNNIINHKNKIEGVNHELDITGPVVMGRAMNIYWDKSSLLSIKPGIYKDPNYNGNIRLLQNTNKYVVDSEGLPLFKTKFDGYLNESLQKTNRYSYMDTYFKSFGNQWDKITERYIHTPMRKRKPKLLKYTIITFILILIIICIYKCLKTLDI